MLKGKINKKDTVTYRKTISYSAECPGLDFLRTFRVLRRSKGWSYPRPLSASRIGSFCLSALANKFAPHPNKKPHFVYDKQGLVPGTGLAFGHPRYSHEGRYKNLLVPLRGTRVFSFCPLSKASFANSQNEKTFSISSRRFLCPGLDSGQYWVSANCNY